MLKTIFLFLGYINKHTIFDEFNLLEKRVNERNGKIIFLIARNERSNISTKLDFINYDNYKVYYTNNLMPKGELIYHLMKILYLLMIKIF